MPSELGKSMSELVKWVQELIAREANKSVRSRMMHNELCHACAYAFQLWDDRTLPTWLCRVVEGEMRDADYETM